MLRNIGNLSRGKGFRKWRKELSRRYGRHILPNGIYSYLLRANENVGRWIRDLFVLLRGKVKPERTTTSRLITTAKLFTPKKPRVHAPVSHPTTISESYTDSVKKSSLSSESKPFTPKRNQTIPNISIKRKKNPESSCRNEESTTVNETRNHFTFEEMEMKNSNTFASSSEARKKLFRYLLLHFMNASFTGRVDIKDM